jgi:ATP-dependent RNA helicase DHX37/DHR1
LISNKSILSTVGENVCSFSDPLDSPKPYFEKKSGKIFCTMKPFFGDIRMELPAVLRPFQTCPLQARWFARFLLEGQIIDVLSKYSDKVDPSAGILTKKALNNSKIIAITHPLLQKKIESRNDLFEAIKDVPTFLLNGVLSWIPAKYHESIRDEWRKLSNMK